MYIDDRSKGYMVKPVKWPGNFSGLRPRRRLGLEILVACEGRASGVSCRVRRPIWQPIGYPAAPTHPPHAIGTRGPLGDQNTSIEASFDFSVQRPLKYPHVRPQMGNFATASRLESGPFPPARSRGVQRDPTTKIAGGQVAGNSNLKLGDRPRTVTDVVTVTTN